MLTDRVLCIKIDVHVGSVTLSLVWLCFLCVLVEMYTVVCVCVCEERDKERERCAFLITAITHFRWTSQKIALSRLTRLMSRALDSSLDSESSTRLMSRALDSLSRALDSHGTHESYIYESIWFSAKCSRLKMNRARAEGL